MPTYGSDGGFQADNRGGVIDEQGNTIVSSDTEFAASPLGVAARTQALYGIPNASFNLTPPDPAAPIVANQNDLPYWSIEDLSGGVMTATTIFDSTTQTWGVELNPGTAASGSSLSLSTRSYILTDDNLSLRQKALAVLSKSGTAAGSTQWNLTLSAIYYDSTDTALSTAFIGTALDTGTWTSFSGTTTSGGSAISASAQYVDLTFALTATAAITGSAKATIKSCLLQTSTGAASQSFLVTETFTSSTTWTRPTGVNYLVAVVVIGAGGGGGGGGAVLERGPASSNYTTVGGGGGGGGGGWHILQNLYVGDQTSVTIGIGAGGTAGTGVVATKAAGGTAQFTGIARYPTAGGNGSNTTFGSYITALAGQGAIVSTNDGLGGNSAYAGGGTPTSTVYGTAYLNGTKGRDASGTAAGTYANPIMAYSLLPNTPLGGGAGGAAGSATTSGGSGTAQIGLPGAGGSAGYGGGGGGAGRSDAGASPSRYDGNAGIIGGSGGGGGVAWRTVVGTATITANGGSGGTVYPASGAGGGGGGGAMLNSPPTAAGTASYNASTLTATGGAGAPGSGGCVIISYVA